MAWLLARSRSWTDGLLSGIRRASDCLWLEYCPFWEQTFLLSTPRNWHGKEPIIINLEVGDHSAPAVSTHTSGYPVRLKGWYATSAENSTRCQQGTEEESSTAKALSYGLGWAGRVVRMRTSRQ